MWTYPSILLNPCVLKLLSLHKQNSSLRSFWFPRDEFSLQSKRRRVSNALISVCYFCFQLAVRRSPCKLWTSCMLARGRNIRSDMWHYFGRRALRKKEIAHIPHICQKKNTNLHLKRDVTNAQTALGFPSRSAAPPRSLYCRKAGSCSDGLFPSSRLLLNSSGWTPAVLLKAARWDGPGGRL